MKIQKITNMLTLGQIRLNMGPVNLKKKKIKILIFEYANLDFCKKKLLVKKNNCFDYALMYIKTSSSMSRFQN